MNKNALITSILQANTISHITNDDRKPKDRMKIISNEELFLSLVGLDESVLIKIANDIHIKV